jgi:hypothetical protein
MYAMMNSNLITKLKFGFGNSKLEKHIVTFSLPAGHSCPFACKCLSNANRITGLISDGPKTEFRCFSASTENIYSATRNARWFNFDLLKKAKTVEGMSNLIHNSLPSCTMVRIHISGDFFSEQYFLAWLNVTLNNPSLVFYGYTKALPFWIKYKNQIPNNFRLTASIGGTHDYLIHKHKLKFAEVVFSHKEAEDKGLEIDHNDSHAYNESKMPFALLLHGIQPKNTKASKALRELKQLGFVGYNKKFKFQNNSRIQILV